MKTTKNVGHYYIRKKIIERVVEKYVYNWINRLEQQI
jgi:hypothetical protein